MKTGKKLQGPLILLAAAFIWGTTFIAQAKAAEVGLPPLFYNATRMLVGAFLLFLFLFIRERKRVWDPLKDKTQRKTLLLGGFLCGLPLCAATFFQQLGMTLGTPPGKGAFLTAFYVVLVPVTGIFFKRRVRPLLWIAVALALVGMYFLCLADFSRPFSETFSFSALSKGDLMMGFSALSFAFQILFVGKYVDACGAVRLSMMQFFTAGILSLVAFFFTETLPEGAVFGGAGIWMILYAGVFSCGIAYTLQAFGQSKTPPAVASLVMCLESVFALISEMVIFHRSPSPEEWIGSGVLFSAIVFASLI